ncbi:DNA repair protein rhp41 [Golovinomyces cichoracearum]|uniref:DNA repair protein rhp41 n=1 Tax=Golovinomyces cichoracearum TaxID=62708 RepID=A0A420I954_9PEZI|nr:DNA repair protein rhp41 [Golovinomyces cichoracearum]
MVKKRGINIKAKQKAYSAKSQIPDVYQEMLAEALPSPSDIQSKPLKRRRTGQKAVAVPSRSTDDNGESSEIETVINATNIYNKFQDEDKNENEAKYVDDQDIADEPFHGKNKSAAVLDVTNHPSLVGQQQTAYREINESSDESDCDWENVEFDKFNDIGLDTASSKFKAGGLELTLTKYLASQEKSVAPRRKVITKEDRILRVAIHKIHILCLLSYLDRRNDWSNDTDVQASLKHLLTSNLLKLLKPRSDLPRFSRSESFKKGLHEISILWKTQFSITERGMRRALWAENEEFLKDFKAPDDADSIFDRTGFRNAAAASELKGSRDVGAQLFCALLRSAGVDTRLACSLQVLPFKFGGPLRTCESKTHGESAQVKNLNSADLKEPIVTPTEVKIVSKDLGPILPPRHRLGHPNAADYHMPIIKNPSPPRCQKIVKAKQIRESQFPVFWVEVFDDVHQKWVPVDPFGTQTIAKTRGFEPPASDRENNMSYVIAFDKEGYARDVTRRYVKAYNGKTLKARVESTNGGKKWWTRIMRSFSRRWPSEVDQIENTELATLEAKEPMPKSIADFKGHSYFVLERHLHRNEVLVRAKECGRIAAGRDISVIGGKKMEGIFRRHDVQVAKSADAWYRLGREVKLGEHPVKILQPRSNSEADDKSLTSAGNNLGLFLEEQTELYQAPPIVNGRVPKNSFGNIDIFVPSMLPQGAVHLPNKLAISAAKIIGIDYADALIGFEFRGRHGMAILSGIVIAKEYEDAVKAVIEGLENEQAEAEEILRSQAALRMWKRLTIALRIKRRIDSYEVLDETTDNFHNQGLNEEVDDDTDIDDEEYVINDKHKESDECCEFEGGFFPD